MSREDWRRSLSTSRSRGTLDATLLLLLLPRLEFALTSPFPYLRDPGAAVKRTVSSSSLQVHHSPSLRLQERAAHHLS